MDIFLKNKKEKYRHACTCNLRKFFREIKRCLEFLKYSMQGLFGLKKNQVFLRLHANTTDSGLFKVFSKVHLLLFCCKFVFC